MFCTVECVPFMIRAAHRGGISHCARAISNEVATVPQQGLRKAVVAQRDTRIGRTDDEQWCPTENKCSRRAGENRRCGSGASSDSAQCCNLHENHWSVDWLKAQRK